MHGDVNKPAETVRISQAGQRDSKIVFRSKTRPRQRHDQETALAASYSWVYQSFWRAVGGAERNRVLLRDYIRPTADDRILDIGCGPGTMVPYLQCAEYVGLDASEEYIDRARRRFPAARFVCQKVDEI